MATVENVSKHAIELTGGALLAPEQTANVDPSAPNEAGNIAAGNLIVTDGSPPPHQIAGAGVPEIPDFAPYTRYPASFVILHAGVLYAAASTFDSGASFSAGDWTAIGGGGSGNVAAAQVAAANLGASHTVDLGSVANKLAIVTGNLTANCALTLSNRAAGQQVWLILTQVGGPWTLTVNGASINIPDTGTFQVVSNDIDGSTGPYVGLIGAGGDVSETGTQTLTNKRITSRVVTVAQSATPTINTDNADVASITGLAQAITSMTTNLSGTPADGDALLVRITDNGTGRAIAWGAKFAATTVALPTTTVASTMLRVEFLWNVGGTWDCVGVA